MLGRGAALVTCIAVILNQFGSLVGFLVILADLLEPLVCVCLRLISSSSNVRSAVLTRAAVLQAATAMHSLDPSYPALPNATLRGLLLAAVALCVLLPLSLRPNFHSMAGSSALSAAAFTAVAGVVGVRGQ